MYIYHVYHQRYLDHPRDDQYRNFMITKRTHGHWSWRSIGSQKIIITRWCLKWNIISWFHSIRQIIIIPSWRWAVIRKVTIIDIHRINGLILCNIFSIYVKIYLNIWPMQLIYSNKKKVLDIAIIICIKSRRDMKIWGCPNIFLHFKVWGLPKIII